MHLKISSGKWRPYCLSLNVFMTNPNNLDSYTVSMNSPNVTAGNLPDVWAVQGDCQWALKNGRNSHWSCEHTMYFDSRQSRPTNHKKVMPANKQVSQMQSHKWLVAWSLPSPYMSQCWNIVNSNLRRNKIQRSLKWTHRFSFKKMHLKMASAKWRPFYLDLIVLTHCGLVTPYGDRDLGQHWLRKWLVAWQHQAITWTNIDWSSVMSSDNHIRAISHKMPQPSITKIHLKITYLKFNSNFSGANVLISLG